MWPDRISNPGPLIYESGAIPTALHGPAISVVTEFWRYWRRRLYIGLLVVLDVTTL